MVFICYILYMYLPRVPFTEWFCWVNKVDLNFTKAESGPKVYLRFRYLKHGSRIKKKKNFLARGRKEGVNVAIKLTTMCLGIKRRVCIKYLIISDINYRRYMLIWKIDIHRIPLSSALQILKHRSWITQIPMSNLH